MIKVLHNSLKPRWGLLALLLQEITLTEWPKLPLEFLVKSMLVLTPRATSGSVVLLQLGSVLMSVVHENHQRPCDVHCLGCHLRPCWCWYPGCLRGPCLGSWSSYKRGTSSWSLLSPVAVRKPMIWAPAACKEQLSYFGSNINDCTMEKEGHGGILWQPLFPPRLPAKVMAWKGSIKKNS